METSFFFSYSVNRINLAAGGQGQASISLGSHDFHIYYINGRVLDTGFANSSSPQSFYADNVLTLLTISDEGETLMNSACPFSTLVGTSQLPFILPEPLILQVKSTLTIGLTNQFTNTALLVDLVFLGIKVRPAAK